MLRRLLFHNFHVVYRFDQWARRRFTPAGSLMLGTVFVAGVFGINTRATLAYELMTLSGALLAVALACAPFFRGRFEVRRHLPRFATAGLPVTYEVDVRNRGRRVQRGLAVREEPIARAPSLDAFFRWREPEDVRRNVFDRYVGYPRWATLMRRRRGAAPAEAELADVRPGASERVDVVLSPLRRGYLRLGPLALVRPDPLGLFRAVVRTGETQSLLVLPRRYAVDWTELLGNARDRLGGMSQSASIGGVEEFASLREYRPGDSLRHIHWKAWARLQQPVVKEFHEECFVRQALVFDTFLPEGATLARFEEAVSVAASFACAPPVQHGRLDLMFVGDRAYRIESGQGPAASDRMLEALACIEPVPAHAFGQLRETVTAQLDEMSACVCVLLAWDEARRELVSRLRAAGLPLLVIVVVEPDDAGKRGPGPMADDPRRFRVVPAGEAQAALAAISSGIDRAGGV